MDLYFWTISPGSKPRIHLTLPQPSNYNVNLNLDGLKQGNCYYFMIENYGRTNKNTDFSTGFTSVDADGGMENVDIGPDEGESYTDTFLIFLVNGVNFRSKHHAFLKELLTLCILTNFSLNYFLIFFL